MRKIFYVIIAITTFFFLATGIILFQHEKNLLLETSREYAHHTLKVLGGMAQLELLSNDYSHVEENLLNWVDIEENVIFSEVALDSGFVIATYGQKGRHPNYFTVTETVPLFDGGSLIYTVDFSAEFIEEQANSLFLKILASGAIITFLLVTSLWLLIYKVAVVPVNRLVDGAKKIGQGDLDFTIKIESKDEFGRLASEFNLMATRLHGLIDELRQSEQKFRNIFDSSSDAIFVHDLKGKMLDVNMVAVQRLGYTREEFMKMTPMDFDSPEFADKVSERIKELMKKRYLLFETCHISKEGKDLPAEVSSRTIKHEGKPAILSVSRDITERRQTELALHASEAHLRTLIETIPDLIWLKDPDGVYISCNPKFESFFGAKEADIIGKTDYDFVDKELADFFRQKDKEAMDADKPSLNEEEVTYADDGHSELLETVKTPMYDSESKLIGVLGIARDITKRKKMEEELLKVQKLESIGVLAGGIAHDFNNLLTAIVNNLFLIKNRTNSEEQVHERIEATEKAVTRAQGLTHQLLTFSKGGAPIKGLLDIRELVSESISIALRGSNVRCENLIPDDVWHIAADAGQMNQAINNIIINADQSMSEGGTLRVNCDNVIIGAENNVTLKEGNYIKLSIEDHGKGILDEHLTKIFDPYFTTKQKGNGLGLSTTYSIINKHGGHINVESKLGVGTVFNIYLPASMEKVTIKKPTEDEPLTGTGKVLIMDDDELVRDSLGEMLISIGYAVEFADNGEKAVDIYKNAMSTENPFDAVIMDLTIPGGMGGKEAIKELLEIDPHVKAIVSSGYSYDPIMSNYRDYGFMAVLTKPYKNIRRFNQFLNSVIEG